jgi:hypothetical protein
MEESVNPITVIRRAGRPQDVRRARGTRAFALAAALGIVLGAGVGGRVAYASDEATGAQMQSLDEQVQEIKSDVLSIASELDRLEEVLLYPSNTQVAVFVSLAEGETARLDSVHVEIDDEPVAHHIYSFKELEALQKGGVQRIYTGNVTTGEHRLAVSIAGKLAGGRDFSGTEQFSFEKGVEPKWVGLTLAATELGKARIELGER